MEIKYTELIKGLKCESTLHLGRNLLRKSWKKEYNKDEFIKDLLDYVRLSMREMVNLEEPTLFDDEAIEILTKQTGTSLF